MENVFVLWLLSRFLLFFFVLDFLYFDYVMPGRRFFFFFEHLFCLVFSELHVCVLQCMLLVWEHPQSLLLQIFLVSFSRLHIMYNLHLLLIIT